MTSAVAVSRLSASRLTHWLAGVALAALCCGPVPAAAQTPIRVQAVRATVVLETARGDSVVLGRVTPGTVLESLQQSGRWIQVAPLPGTPGTTAPWRRGWILATELTSLDPRPGRPPSRAAEFLVRGFGQYSGTLFTAKDSIEAVLDATLGQSFGGGVQVVFRNGFFAQGSIDRFEKTGSRVVASNQRLFRVDVPNTVRITPIAATLGYRDARSDRSIGYVGAGAGWHLLEERSPALASAGDIRQGHVGFHVIGGAEYRLASSLWLAGEVQWTTVPDALGQVGIGQTFGETDLGGTTFRVNVFIGR
jgi:opacity protein-like surface antigen